MTDPVIVGNATLYLGDSLEIMPRYVPDRSVDLILCDLPYGTTDIGWDRPLPFDRLWEEYRRVLKPSGCVLLFGSQPFTSELVLSNKGWFKYCLVWNKNKCGSPGLAKVRPMKVHEDIAVFAPGRTCYNPIMEEGEPYRRKAKSPDGYQTRCNTHGYGLKQVNEFSNSGTRYPKSIINISRDFSAQQQVHPTQKPVPLMRWLILTYSNPGDTVMDNCMGSGTTGVACANTGRRFIGIELEPNYFQIARRRIEDALAKENDNEQ